MTIETGVIRLFGQRYPLGQRGIALRGATPFPQKITIGDYSRADHVVESELVFSDFTGGIGIYWADPTRHRDRYWWGSLDGRYRYLTLPPLVEKRGNLPLVERFVSLAGSLYAVASGHLYRWSEITQGWTDLGAVTGAVTDAAVYDGKLYLLTTSALWCYDPNTGALASQPTGGFALAVWDDKLFRLDPQNQMRWSLNPMDPASWQDGGKLLAPPGHSRQLVLYFTAAGDLVIHAVGKDGLYAYDFASTRFYQTSLTWPETERVGRAAMWRGELYVPVGLSIYKYNPNAVTMVGPDKDDGLPPNLMGQVQQVVPGHGYWFVVLAASQGGTLTPAMAPGWYTTEQFFPSVSATAAVLVSAGDAFHLTAQWDNVSQVGDVITASTGDQYRLWMSTDTGVYTIDLPIGLHNPLQNPTQAYAEQGQLITSWWDMGWAELPKLALGLDVDAVVPEGAEISFSVAFDESPQWIYVGTLTSTGRRVFRLGDLEGIPFQRVRLLIAMKRGHGVRDAPYLRQAVLTYLRIPKMLLSWQVQLQLTDPYCVETVGVPAEALVKQLEAALRNRRAGDFQYTDADGSQVNRRVFITELVAVDVQGPRREGRYTVTLVELES